MWGIFYRIQVFTLFVHISFLCQIEVNIFEKKKKKNRGGKVYKNIPQHVKKSRTNLKKKKKEKHQKREYTKDKTKQSVKKKKKKWALKLQKEKKQKLSKQFY